MGRLETEWDKQNTWFIEAKDMILKESLEEKRAETARAIETFGAEEKPV